MHNASTDMDIVYRIYTEDSNRAAIVSAVSERFESFTLHETTGYFKGEAEKSIVIEIVDAREEDIRVVAAAIRALNGQKTVLVMGLRGQARKINDEKNESGSSD
jgi:hypothetical protein